jgi:hypothetical protein
VADARRTRRWRRIAGVAVVGTAVTLVAVLVGLPLAAWMFVRAVALLMRLCVWFAFSLSAGVSLWTIAGTIGGAVTNALTSREATIGLIALVVLGAAAIFGIQRIFESEEESLE